MPNHFHILAVINSAHAVSPFIGYIKQETSATINRIEAPVGRTCHGIKYYDPSCSPAKINAINATFCALAAITT